MKKSRSEDPGPDGAPCNPALVSAALQELLHYLLKLVEKKDVNLVSREISFFFFFGGGSIGCLQTVKVLLGYIPN